MIARSWKQSARASAWRPARWPHQIRTMIGYVLLGTQAALVTLATPFVAAISRSREQRQLRMQRLVHLAWRLYLRELRWLRIARVHFPPDVERLRGKGVLVVANHPGRLDVAALLAAMPQADLIVKRAYYDNPLLGLASRAAGYQPAEAGADLVEACAEKLVRGRSLIVFPEGTRSPAGGLGPFQRGAAHIALRCDRDPLPVAITCNPPSLHKDQHWWEAEPNFDVTLRIGEPIAVKELASRAATRGQAARAVTAALREHFQRRVVGVQA